MWFFGNNRIVEECNVVLEALRGVYPGLHRLPPRGEVKYGAVRGDFGGLLMWLGMEPGGKKTVQTRIQMYFKPPFQLGLFVCSPQDLREPLSGVLRVMTGDGRFDRNCASYGRVYEDTVAVLGVDVRENLVALLEHAHALTLSDTMVEVVFRDVDVDREKVFSMADRCMKLSRALQRDAYAVMEKRS